MPRYWEPRFASLRWNHKKEVWQLRFGTSKVQYENPSLFWAQVWGKVLSDAEGLPLRLIVPSGLVMPGISDKANDRKWEDLPQEEK